MLQRARFYQQAAADKSWKWPHWPGRHRPSNDLSIDAFDTIRRTRRRDGQVGGGLASALEL